MTRALTAIALLLAMGACNRGSQNVSGNAVNVSNAAVANNAAAAAPAPAPEAPTPEAPAADQADANGQEGDVAADQEIEEASSPAQEAREGCAGEIGLARARELVLQCRDVSPATRPPCNTANSCEMIRDEIERGCGLLGADAPPFCVPR